LVNHAGARWKPVTVDLTDFAGTTARVRLENAANGWAWEFGYWSDLTLNAAPQRAAR
jgi:hypothetical protein